MTDIYKVFQQANFPIGLLIFSPNTEGVGWHCVEANKAALDFLAKDELVSKDWADIFADFPLSSDDKNRTLAVNDTTWLLANALENPHDASIIVTLTDVSEAHNKVVIYEKLIEKLKSSNKDLEHFAYVASHDLREPLRKIIAFSERLNKKYASSLQGDGSLYLSRMIDATQRMQAFIDDLLMFSRFSRDASEKIDVDLNEILRGVLSDFEIPIENTKAVLDIQPLPTIKAVKTQMTQLFQNLVSNALKFKKPDVAPQISITFSTIEEHLHITVRDNGIGFEEADAETIFALFQRLNGRSQYEGTGIGLAVCKKIVENHGGTITASSKPDVEAVFTIKLPKTAFTE